MRVETEFEAKIRREFRDSLGKIFIALDAADDFTNTVQSRRVSRKDISEIAHKIHGTVSDAKVRLYQIILNYCD